MNSTRIVFAFLVYLMFGCGDASHEPVSKGPEGIHGSERQDSVGPVTGLGKLEQALSVPNWYGFGQVQGGPTSQKRWECFWDTNPCYIPKHKVIGYTVPDNSMSTVGGYSGQWWLDRFYAALWHAYYATGGANGFAWYPCNGTPCEDTANEYGPLFMLWAQRTTSNGPNAATDALGWVAPSGLTTSGRFKKYGQCNAYIKPASIVASSSGIWCTAAAGGAFPTQSDCNNLNVLTAENVWKRQIFQCLGLGNYGDQGVVTGDHVMELGDPPLFPKGYYVSFWYTGLDILRPFEYDMLQNYVP